MPCSDSALHSQNFRTKSGVAPRVHRERGTVRNDERGGVPTLLSVETTLTAHADPEMCGKAPGTSNGLKRPMVGWDLRGSARVDL